MSLEERIKELEFKMDLVIKTVDELIAIHNRRVEKEKKKALEDLRLSVKLKKQLDKIEDSREIDEMEYDRYLEKHGSRLSETLKKWKDELGH
jgi:hypothetical protein